MKKYCISFTLENYKIKDIVKLYLIALVAYTNAEYEYNLVKYNNHIIEDNRIKYEIKPVDDGMFELEVHSKSSTILQQVDNFMESLDTLL